MRMTVLGTGHALVTRCYNACFVLEGDAPGAPEDDVLGAEAPGAPAFLVDAGGGNGVLTQLERAGIDWRRIGDLFVSHTHIDHLLGAVWVLRLVCDRLNREGEGVAPAFTVWGNAEVIAMLDLLARQLLRPQESRFLGGPVRLRSVEDGEQARIMGCPITFFDIRSKGARQFGFSLEYAAGHRLAFCGDEPFSEANREHVAGAEWLVHEAFCLHADIDRYRPHPIHHGTVREATETAEHLGVHNLVLIHTEDDDLSHRRARYTAEGQPHFSGTLHVPDDLDAYEL